MYDHDLVPGHAFQHVRVERRPVYDPRGEPVEGLHNVWIVLDNEAELNAYTTDTIKEVILAFRHASNDRGAVCAVFTGAGSRAFCAGGNTREYATRYAGHSGEYRQYMRLFNDMVSAILACDKPVICRVNGMRVGGGQEIGMACDFSVASDLARFGQVGPKHGSAPDGGATDFLHLYVGIEQAMLSCTTAAGLWSAHKAMRLGLLTEIAPVLRVDGELVPNPLVETRRWIDERGQIVYGEPLTGDALAAGKATLARGTIDLSSLDRAVDRLSTKLMMTFPDCCTKTIETLRKKKLDHWNANKEQSRAWLSLNMMTEAKAGFRAFESGGSREVDFIALRQRLAAGATWEGSDLENAIMPRPAH
ncbi:MAG: 6-oxocyclohex-1-ene-1-carbonyl-CoA hydratase [Kofleriaceae bacterium]|nr:MAG: 6-oxocyclohex-1-ene-1-carbonyl-CoA hydratase [Kofleriaceae bacterium]MBZ0230951.1 6-oxocyclohex-1-ene-1-carbonyl-CoA hydratase [Kofleriaceae bacterium]